MWIVNLALVFRIPCNSYSTAKVWYVQQKIYVAYDTTLVESFWITSCYKTKRYLKTLVYNHKFVPTLSISSISALYTLLVLSIIQTILMINLSTTFFFCRMFEALFRILKSTKVWTFLILFNLAFRTYKGCKLRFRFSFVVNSLITTRIHSKTELRPRKWPKPPYVCPTIPHFSLRGNFNNQNNFAQQECLIEKSEYFALFIRYLFYNFKNKGRPLSFRKSRLITSIHAEHFNEQSTWNVSLNS